MQITFDTLTIQDWQARNIRAVFVRFIEQGCEGTKVQVLETFDPIE